MTEYRFDSWSFDSRSGILHNADRRTRLRPQTATVLECLIENAPAIASRDELRERLWPGNTIVDFDTGINSCIKQIRQALGESAACPRYLHTVPKRGFRWSAADPAARSAACEASRAPRRTGPTVAVLAITLLVAVVIMARWSFNSGGVPVIVVLPFEGSSPTSESARLIKRIHIELIHALGDDSTVQVISRRSVAAKVESSLTMAQLGDAFGARILIDGSVREVAGGYVVAISLVDGRSDAFIWGELVEFSAAEVEVGVAKIQVICLEAVAAYRASLADG